MSGLSISGANIGSLISVNSIAGGVSGVSQSLPSAAGVTGLYFYAKNDADSLGSVVLNTILGQVIDGVFTNYTLVNRNQYVLLIPCAGNWLVVAGN